MLFAVFAAVFVGGCCRPAFCFSEKNYSRRAFPEEFNIVDFGAVGDGRTKNTAAIQRAIDACAVRGGKVIVPPGVFMTGTIYLKSNVEFHISKGATLLGSPDLKDYNEPDAYPQNFFAKSEGWSPKHLILALEVENVALTGTGIIDGNARAFFDNTPRGYGEIGWRNGICNAKDFENCGRPGQEIVFVECKNIKVKDLQLKDMTCWSCFFHGCDNVQISGLRIETDIRYANTDGIDIDSCRNVTVSDCIIRTGDDAIAIRCSVMKLKNKNRMCENITVNNCVFHVSASGMRISVGGGTIRNVVVSNVVIEHAGRGINVSNSYGSRAKGVHISDVSFNNIIIRNTPSPILISSGTANSTAYLKNISFNNVNIASNGQIMIAGLGGRRMSNISFSNLYFKCLENVFEVKKNGVDLGSAVFKIQSADNVFFNNVVVADNKIPLLATHDTTNVCGEIKSFREKDDPGLRK